MWYTKCAKHPGRKDKISDFISLSAVAGESIEMTTDIVTDVWYATIAGYTKAKSDIAEKLALPAKLNKDYDFNDALDALYNKENFIKMINTCQKSREEALEKLKELADLPTKFEPLYQKARDIYDQLDGAMDLLESPRGSYDSYSKETHQKLVDINSGLRSLNNELDLISN